MSHASDCRWSRSSAEHCQPGARCRPGTRHRARRDRWTVLCCGFLLAFSTALPVAQAQETADFFRDRCTSCHTIGGGHLTGPDLKNVTQRQDRKWLADFILNPDVVLDSGDPYAQKILTESRGVRMTPIPGMTRQQRRTVARSHRGGVATRGVSIQGSSDLQRPFHATGSRAGTELLLRVPAT